MALTKKNHTSFGARAMDVEQLRVAITAPVENYKLLLGSIVTVLLTAVLSMLASMVVVSFQERGDDERSLLVDALERSRGSSVAELLGRVGEPDYRFAENSAETFLYVVRTPPDVSFLRVTFSAGGIMDGWQEVSTAHPGKWFSETADQEL